MWDFGNDIVTHANSRSNWKIGVMNESFGPSGVGNVPWYHEAMCVQPLILQSRVI